MSDHPPAPSDAEVEALIEEIRTSVQAEDYVVFYKPSASKLIAALRDRQQHAAATAAAIREVSDLPWFAKGDTSLVSIFIHELRKRLKTEPDALADLLAKAREEGRRQGVSEQPTWDAYMAACRALNHRNEELRAHGIEPKQIPADAPHHPTPSPERGDAQQGGQANGG